MDERGKVFLADPGMLTVTHEPVGALPKAWRHWPFDTEYQEDAPLNITKEVDVHSFGMTMIEVGHACLSKYKKTP